MTDDMEKARSILAIVTAWLENDDQTVANDPAPLIATTLRREREEALGEAVRLREAVVDSLFALDGLLDGDFKPSGETVVNTLARIRQALSSTPRSAALVLVPREPTEAMVDAGTAILSGPGGIPDPDYSDDCRTMYRSMVAAYDGLTEGETG